MYYRKAGSAFLIGIGIQAEQREVVYSEQLIGGDDRVYNGPSILKNVRTANALRIGATAFRAGLNRGACR